MEGKAPARPDCHHSSLQTKGTMSRCGSGSHTEPSWRKPALEESIMRRAMLMCATASPESSSRLREKQKESAKSETSSETQATMKVSPRRARRSASAGEGSGLDFFGLKVREFAEEGKAFFNLRGVELLQARGSEAFDGEGPHDGAVEHGFFEDRGGELLLRSDVAEEASGEGIARAGGIDYLCERQGGNAEGMAWVAVLAKGAVAEESGGSVLAVLDDEALGAHFENLLGGADKIVVAGEELGFAVVDEQRVEAGEHAGEVGGVIVDPVIHGVAADEFGSRHFGAHISLKDGIDVGEEEVVGVLVFGGNARREALEDVQFRVEGLRLVEVGDVGAGPGEAFAAGMLDAAGINAAAGEDGFIFRSKVFADDGDNAHVGEVAGGEGEVGGGSAEAPLGLSGRGFNGVKRYAAYDQNRHSLCLCAFVEILADEEVELAAGFRRDGFGIGEHGKFEGRGAAAVSLARQRGDGRADDLAGVGGVLVEDGDDLLNRHVVVTFAPAVVVGDHGDGGVADFRFAGELGFLKVGHADNVGSPASVEVGLGACGELRAFHADVGSAGLADDAFAGAAVRDGLGDGSADGVAECDVSDEAFAEKRGD